MLAAAYGHAEDERALKSPDPSDDLLKPKRRPLFDLRTSFLTGIIVAAPVLITAYLTITFVNFVDNNVARVLPAQYNPETYLPFSIPGIGVVIVFCGLVLLGMFTKNIVGRWVIRAGERIVAGMPVIRNIYSALKQIFETVLASTSQSFKEVVLVEYPRRGLWSLAFVVSRAKGEIQERAEDSLVNLFVPTTPNPTSGYLLFAPEKDIIKLNMSVEEGAKLVISGGLVAPDFDGAQLGPGDRIRALKEDIIEDHEMPAAMAVNRPHGPKATGTHNG